MINIETVLEHYVIAALWSSTDDDRTPLDDNYGAADIAQATYKQMVEDVTDFVTANKDLLEVSGQSDEQIGHDFWLTRCGHGAGFWDRGLGDIGEALSDASRPYGSVDLYVGDDGLIYD